MRFLWRWFRRAVLALSAAYVATVAAVMWCSDANLARHGHGAGLEGPVDAAIVLGGGIDPDEVLGYSSRRRVRAGEALLMQGKAGALILTGASQFAPPVPSGGEMMRDIAVSLGADPAKLVAEPEAVSTFENLRFSFRIARERGWTRLALVTDAFHIERAQHLAAYFGQPDVGLVAVGGLRYDTDGNRVVSILREALAWWYNLYKVGAWEAMTLAGSSSGEREAVIQ